MRARCRGRGHSVASSATVTAVLQGWQERGHGGWWHQCGSGAVVVGGGTVTPAAADTPWGWQRGRGHLTAMASCCHLWHGHHRIPPQGSGIAVSPHGDVTAVSPNGAATTVSPPWHCHRCTTLWQCCCRGTPRHCHCAATPCQCHPLSVPPHQCHPISATPLSPHGAAPAASFPRARSPGPAPFLSPAHFPATRL